MRRGYGWRGEHWVPFLQRNRNHSILEPHDQGTRKCIRCGLLEEEEQEWRRMQDLLFIAFLMSLDFVISTTPRTVCQWICRQTIVSGCSASGYEDWSGFSRRSMHFWAAITQPAGPEAPAALSKNYTKHLRDVVNFVINLFELPFLYRYPKLRTSQGGKGYLH